MLENKTSQEIAENVIYLNNKLEDLKERRNRAGKMLETARKPHCVLTDGEKSLEKYLHNELVRTNFAIYKLETYIYRLSTASISDYKKDYKSNFINFLHPKAYMDLQD